MEGIPFINIVAIVHVCFIAAFIGALMAENWMEINVLFTQKNGSGLFRGCRKFFRFLLKPLPSQPLLNGEAEQEVHRGNIRNHLWIDIMVELPLAFGVMASGVTMAILVEKITTLHLIKIALACCVMTGMFFCVKGVLRRHRMLRENASEAAIALQTRSIFVTATLWEPLLIPVVILGFWLGYHRILDTIY